MSVSLTKLTGTQLCKRVADLTHERDELQRKYEDLVLTSAITVSELQGKVDGLAVESANNIEFIKDACWVFDDKTERYVDADDCRPETPVTDVALAGIRAQVWVEAKFYAKSMIESDACEFVDFLFDSKVQQLRGEASQLAVKLDSDKVPDPAVHAYDGENFYIAGWNARGKADREKLRAAGITVQGDE